MIKYLFCFTCLVKCLSDLLSLFKIKSSHEMHRVKRNPLFIAFTKHRNISKVLFEITYLFCVRKNKKLELTNRRKPRYTITYTQKVRIHSITV